MLPLVRRLSSGPETAAGINQCHIQLGRLTDELGSTVERVRNTDMDRETENELRRIL